MLVENPIIWGDMPDPDIIRLEDTYYMVSTTMFTMPGGPILKSKDLCHWEIVSYIFNTIEENDTYLLKNGKHAYGRGQWATSLKYYKGRFYACFVCHDMKKTYIYYTDDIEKSGWERFVLEDVYHDMSFLFYKDKPYLIYDNGDIKIVELKEDLSGIKEGGLNQLLFSTPRDNIALRCEGCRAYYMRGYIYLWFIEWPSDGRKRRRQVCYRSKELLGPYERKIIMDDDMGYLNQGIAQGVLVDSVQGDWYAILFQDHGAVGRILNLMPVSWEADWPVLGKEGKVPCKFEIPFNVYSAKTLVTSDSFNHKQNQLDLRWEWNHNPDEAGWSFTKRPGYLRLRTNTLAKDLLTARNTLTQKTMGPNCTCSVKLDATQIKTGDYAGLVAFQSTYGMIGIRKETDGTKRIVLTKREDGREIVEQSICLDEEDIWLKVYFDFQKGVDEATFYYSYDENNWQQLGEPLHMKYTIDIFTGYKIGIYYYASLETGGKADFSEFQYKVNHVLINDMKG